MAEITFLNIPTGLFGRWRAEWDSDDGRSEYHIGVHHGQLKVTGKDYGDGEDYIISNIAYDRNSVQFDTLMPSTGRKGHLSLCMIATGEVQMSFTFTDICSAIKVTEGN